ncbi:hypothetical protein JHW43_008955 [Diplocarpon mali]|nr:hypothetical protein JHW43_008955 [Diplocarpon mali]
MTSDAQTTPRPHHLTSGSSDRACPAEHGARGTGGRGSWQLAVGSWQLTLPSSSGSPKLPPAPPSSPKPGEPGHAYSVQLATATVRRTTGACSSRGLGLALVAGAGRFQTVPLCLARPSRVPSPGSRLSAPDSRAAAAAAAATAAVAPFCSQARSPVGDSWLRPQVLPGAPSPPPPGLQFRIRTWAVVRRARERTTPATEGPCPAADGPIAVTASTSQRPLHTGDPGRDSASASASRPSSKLYIAQLRGPGAGAQVRRSACEPSPPFGARGRAGAGRWLAGWLAIHSLGRGHLGTQKVSPSNPPGMADQAGEPEIGRPGKRKRGGQVEGDRHVAVPAQVHVRAPPRIRISDAGFRMPRGLGPSRAGPAPRPGRPGDRCSHRTRVAARRDSSARPRRCPKPASTPSPAASRGAGDNGAPGTPGSQGGIVQVRACPQARRTLGRIPCIPTVRRGGRAGRPSALGSRLSAPRPSAPRPSAPRLSAPRLSAPRPSAPRPLVHRRAHTLPGRGIPLDARGVHTSGRDRGRALWQQRWGRRACVIAAAAARSAAHSAPAGGHSQGSWRSDRRGTVPPVLVASTPSTAYPSSPLYLWTASPRHVSLLAVSSRRPAEAGDSAGRVIPLDPSSAGAHLPPCAEIGLRLRRLSACLLAPHPASELLLLPGRRRMRYAAASQTRRLPVSVHVPARTRDAARRGPAPRAPSLVVVFLVSLSSPPPDGGRSSRAVPGSGVWGLECGGWGSTLLPSWYSMVKVSFLRHHASSPRHEGQARIRPLPALLTRPPRSPSLWETGRAAPRPDSRMAQRRPLPAIGGGAVRAAIRCVGVFV